MVSTSYDLNGKRVWIAGHTGMVGKALMRRLADEGCVISTVDRKQVDLTRQDAVETWMAATRPQLIFVAAAKVGGIGANDRYPADFIYDNLMIEANIIATAHRLDVERLIFLGSSCIYPRLAAQPISEDALLSGPLEPTNQWYAVAKIAGIKLCQAYRRQHGCAFISAQPTNLYGRGDNFDLENSHVLPALIRKAHEAKLAGNRDMTIWGSGEPLREFLNVDDLADALVFLARGPLDHDIVNIGSGEEVSIRALAELVAAAVGFTGDLVFDASRPDGTPRKLIDSSRLNALGWRPKIALQDGVADTYRWFLSNSGHVRGRN